MTPGAKIRFVVFAAPRTGSNLLCGLLNSHPQILCHHGLFNPAGIHYALDHRDRGPYLGTVEKRDRGPEAFIERVWRHNHGKIAVGFKFNLGEHPAAVEAVLRHSEVRKVLLARRNRLRTYISERIAVRSGQWESYSGTAITPSGPIRVDPEDLFGHVERNRRYYSGLEDGLRLAGQPWLNVDYESLDDSTAGNGLDRILTFLGLAPRSAAGPHLTAGSVKRNPGELRTLVANFEEIKLALAGTELEADLEAGPLRPVFCVVTAKNTYA